MYFFKRHETGSSKRLLAESGGSAANMATFLRLLRGHLTGEEKPGRMLLELSLLVLLLHVWVLVYWLRPTETVTPALPLTMQVSLIAAPAPKPAFKPQASKPAPVAKKPKPKPVITKKPPKAPQPHVTRPTEPVPAPASVKPEAASSPAPATAPSSAATAQATSAPKAELFTEANFRANYGFNPKPDYPRIARNRGWQGKVLLRVQVSAEGASEKVTLHRSSGHETLDDSAVEAVKKWRFIPAKRGDKPVASSVIVPILFKLHD